MTAFAAHLQDFFSDRMLDLELFFDRIFRRRRPTTEPPKIEYKIPATPAPSAPPTGGTAAVARPSVLPHKKETAAAPKAGIAAPKEKMPFSIRMLRLTGKDRLFLFDQLSTLVGSGVTVIDALNLVRAQTRNSGMKQLYAEMIHRVNSGMGLAETMRLFPHIFPDMQTALIEAAEKSGNLKLVLEDLVSDMDNHQEFLRKVKGAMFYPVILIALALILVAGMMAFVIPRISSMYAQANVRLPALTRVVITISDFVREQWPLILGSVFGAVLLLSLLFTKTRFGKLLWENLVSLVPVFGTIAKEKNLMIIAANMAMLLKSGVLISEAFAITEKTVGNLHYKRAIAHLSHDVVMGKTISESMGLTNVSDKKFRENKLFPLQFAQLVSIGETTGTISGMLTKIRSNYHKSIDYKLKNISTVIEPLMIFVVAALVGTILMAVMLPFFYIGTTIN